MTTPENRGDREDRRAWLRDLHEQRERLERRQVQAAPRSQCGPSYGKGIGPNKACGHKGGICRQGSKRG